MSLGQKNKLEHIRQFVEAGDARQAKPLLNDYVKDYPDDAEAWFLGAQLMSDPARKIQILERCLSLDADHEGARQALLDLRPDAIFPPRSRDISSVALPAPELEPVKAVAPAPSRGPVLPALLMVAASVIMALSSIALLSAVSRIASAETPAVAANPTLTPDPTAVPRLVDPEPSAWEYLTLQYSQMPASFGDSDSGYFVIGAVSDPLLTAQLFGEINACLDATWSESSRLCAAKVSRNLPYYMTALGELGWELVSMIDKSDSSYGVEAHFKRPARTPSVVTSL